MRYVAKRIKEESSFNKKLKMSQRIVEYNNYQNIYRNFSSGKKSPIFKNTHYSVVNYCLLFLNV